MLACIDRHFTLMRPDVLIGRGDDCAVLEAGKKLCVSTDLFLEDSHFRVAYFSPGEIGHKALAVNISDLAAMGARPTGFTLGLVLPSWVDCVWLDSFFQGMAEAAAAHGMQLVGGDIARSDKIGISITAMGEKQDGSSLLLRGGLMPGDILFLVGDIGLARIGLQELEESGRAALQEWPAACAAHLLPKPQVSAGLMLARAGYNARPPVVMDVSDGLAADLPRLLRQGPFGAELEIPIDLLHAEARRHAALRGEDAVVEAYLGGEDYALLGACAPDMAHVLRSAIPEYRQIGKVASDCRIFCNGHDMGRIKGFDHFTAQ